LPVDPNWTPKLITEPDSFEYQGDLKKSLKRGIADEEGGQY
jgi:hypothetical protein